MNKRDILNQIDSKKKELARLETALKSIPEGHMSKLRKYLDTKTLGRYKLIDSVTDETCGVLFPPEIVISDGTIRSFRLEWLIKNVFTTPKYEIKSSYATSEGLVLEVHEN